MINTNELRIGSWVLYPHTQKELFQITEPRQIELANILLPIPLSPEWLERCGFAIKHEATEQEPLTYSVLKMDLDIAREEEGYYLRYECQDSYYDCNIGAPFQYLHQLQNLYFALTGEELNVKL